MVQCTINVKADCAVQHSEPILNMGAALAGTGAQGELGPQLTLDAKSEPLDEGDFVAPAHTPEVS